MIRILIFLAVVFLLGLGFAWLADRPGDLLLTFQGYQYQVSLLVAASAVVAVVAVVMIAWWLIKSLWNSPYFVARYFRVRRRDRGYQALSTGMIAAGAGDAALARKMNRQAIKLIRSDQEPLVNLLDAQTSILEGDHEPARKKFEMMLDDPELRLLGLRGLYLEAERVGDRAAARHYAGRAADVAPQLAWAADSTMEEKTLQGDWDGAIRLVDAQKTAKQIERKAGDRRRAVLLTAKAQALAETDPNAAKAAAVEANRLQPEFVPAAIAAAKVAIRNGDTRKSAKILEAAWRANPHPDIAELYVHARHGDSAHDRLSRAKKLQAVKRNHPESALAVARAALAAGEVDEAREAAQAAIRMQPREGAYMVLADIEDAAGNEGKVRQLLAKAVRAPRDPAWVADGYESTSWEAASPLTGRIDAFEWRVPTERLGQVIEADADAEPEQFVAPALPAPAKPTPVPAPADTSAPAVEIAPKAETVPAKPVESKAVTEIDAKPETVPAAASVSGDTAPSSGAPPEPANDRPAPALRPPADALVPAKAEFAGPGAAAPPLPDDPGVDTGQREEPRRRFKLF